MSDETGKMSPLCQRIYSSLLNKGVKPKQARAMATKAARAKESADLATIASGAVELAEKRKFRFRHGWIPVETGEAEKTKLDDSPTAKPGPMKHGKKVAVFRNHNDPKGSPSARALLARDALIAKTGQPHYVDSEPSTSHKSAHEQKIYSSWSVYEGIHPSKRKAAAK